MTVQRYHFFPERPRGLWIFYGKLTTDKIKTNEIMDNEKKRAKVIEMIDDLYDDNGMAVVNLMTDYMSEKDWGHLYDRLDRDGAFRDNE